MCARLSSTVYLWLVVFCVTSIESQKNIPLSIGFLSPFNYPPNLYAQIVRHTGRFQKIRLTESTELTGITMRHAVLIFSLRQGGQPAGLAFTVAIEEINARSDILPNHQLVPQVSTSNTENGLTIQATFELITQKQIKGLVGEYTSEATQMARCHLKLYVIHVTVNLYSPLQRKTTQPVSSRLKCIHSILFFITFPLAATCAGCIISHKFHTRRLRLFLTTRPSFPRFSASFRP